MCHSFYQVNPGQVISKLNFCRILKPAWLKTFTPENIINGFKKAGVYPYNPSAIPLPKPQTGGEQDKGDRGNEGDDDNNDCDGGNGGWEDLGDSETGAERGGGLKDGGGGDHSVGGGAGGEDVSRHGGVLGIGDSASIGGGNGEMAGDGDGCLDGDGIGDTGDGEGGDQSQSLSDGGKAGDNFTVAQIQLYTRRFEEGYDLYDPAYVAWLEVTHPEAVPAD